MSPSNDTLDLFFHDLKKYNSTNYRHICGCDLTNIDSTAFKAFSSVVTRYFIFVEKHPELSDIDAKMLYFQAKIDLVAKYFSEYPMSDPSKLKPFKDIFDKYIDIHEEDSYEQLAAV